ncbi:Superoxide dismutase [Cu-Zn] [Boothiomyces macroporosus]|uniref:Superoxide dismutase [Cu-Zn] n=1 Tax=Boothiomyces macroporosus TaxID=261099 RepID=A0AAD5URX9_9FUNG|nr:Superoxide dismutase [Cu-Zn] [Boothiomyces macroporosus]
MGSHLVYNVPKLVQSKMLPAALLLASALNAKTAIVQLKPDSTSNLGATISGTVKFEQPDKNSLIKITLDIKGLAAGTTHGWHVHNLPVPPSQNCTAAGPHFNPMNKTHGAPEDEVRHYGDLGNFVTDYKGDAFVVATDRLLSLFGDTAVNALNRGLVIHQNADDLGRGNSSLSLTTGNAGGRLACGNIVEVTDSYNTLTGTSSIDGVTVTQSVAPAYTLSDAPVYITTANQDYHLVSGATTIGSAIAFVLALGGFLLGML